MDNKKVSRTSILVGCLWFEIEVEADQRYKVRVSRSLNGLVSHAIGQHEGAPPASEPHQIVVKVLHRGQEHWIRWLPDTAPILQALPQDAFGVYLEPNRVEWFVLEGYEIPAPDGRYK
jgi:hypothetical protein